MSETSRQPFYENLTAEKIEKAYDRIYGPMTNQPNQQGEKMKVSFCTHCKTEAKNACYYDHQVIAFEQSKSQPPAQSVEEKLNPIPPNDRFKDLYCSKCETPIPLGQGLCSDCREQPPTQQHEQRGEWELLGGLRTDGQPEKFNQPYLVIQADPQTFVRIYGQNKERIAKMICEDHNKSPNETLLERIEALQKERDELRAENNSLLSRIEDLTH